MNKIFLAFAICLSGALCVQHSSASADRTDTSVVVMLDKDKKGFVTKVNSQIPSQGLLKALTELNTSGVHPVLLVHEKSSLEMISNLTGILAKAGFLSPRIFYFGKDKDWMREISYSAEIPFAERMDFFNGPRHTSSVIHADRNY